VINKNTKNKSWSGAAMISHRTRLAVIAYASIFPRRTIVAPPSPVPGYGVFEHDARGAARHVKFLELDVDAWRIPRMRRCRTVFDVIVAWFFVYDRTRHRTYFCFIRLDLHEIDRGDKIFNYRDDPLFVTENYVYIPSLPRDDKLAVWAGCELRAGERDCAIKQRWRAVALPPKLGRNKQIVRAARIARGTVPR
jgi:hypothetical protein